MKFVAKGLRVAGEVVESDRCLELPEVGTAWAQLRWSKATDATWREAKKWARKLERCRKRAIRHAKRTLRANGKKLRKQVINTLVRQLLENHVDVHGKATGKRADYAKLTISGLGSSAAYHFMKAHGTTLSAVGFRKVRLYDGIYYHWTYELNPDGDADAVRAATTFWSLDKPLKL